MAQGKRVYAGKLVNVYVKKETLPNGHAMNVEYVDHPGAVLILPIFENGEIILIRQYRPCVNKYIWELPAGTLEKHESVRACVHRELLEETGYRAKTITKIGSIVPVPGYSNECIHMFKATGLTKGVKRTMVDEVISEKAYLRSQVIQMLHQGKIIDAKTICALSFYFLSEHSFWK